LKAAELRRRLRRQPDVADDPDVRLRDRAHARHHATCAFELDDVGAALLDHPDRARNGLLVRHLVGPERQVADDERMGRRPRDGTSQEDHLVERPGKVEEWPSITMAAVSPDQDHLDAGLVGDARAGRVVRGDHHDLVAALFHLGQLGQRQLARRRRRGCWDARAGAHDAPFSRTLSISRVEPTRVATAECRAVESATST